MEPVESNRPPLIQPGKKIPKEKKSIEHKTEAVGRKPLTQSEKAARKEKLRASKSEVRFEPIIVHRQLFEKPDGDWYEIPHEIPLIDEKVGDTGPSKKELQELEKQGIPTKNDKDLVSPNEDGFSFGKKLKKALAKKRRMGPKKIPKLQTLHTRMDPKNSSHQLTGRPVSTIPTFLNSPSLQEQSTDLEDLYQQAMKTINSEHFIWADLVDRMSEMQRSHMQLDLEDIAFLIVYGVKTADKSKLPSTLAQILSIYKGKQEQLHGVLGYLKRLKTGGDPLNAENFAEILSSVGEKCGIKISSTLLAESERISKHEISEFVRKKRAEKEKADSVILKHDLILLEKAARRYLRSKGAIFKWENVEEMMKELLTERNSTLAINYDLIKSHHIINHLMDKAKLDALIRLRNAAKNKFSIKEPQSYEKLEKKMMELLINKELEFDLIGEDEVTSDDIHEFIHKTPDIDDADDDI